MLLLPEKVKFTLSCDRRLGQTSAPHRCSWSDETGSPAVGRQNIFAAARKSRPPKHLASGALKILGFGLGCGPGMKLLNDLFSHRFGLGEQVQVVWSAGLRVGPRHIEPAKGMPSDDCPRALAIDVKIAHVEVAAGAFNFDA